MNISTKIYTFLFGKYVGQDELGNRYYMGKEGGSEAKRWVAYKNVNEPSLVPASWHGWLHKSTDEVPSNTKYKPYPWQKKHLPNLSGTKLAYYPAGHVRKGGERRKATGDYAAWNPNEESSETSEDAQISAGNKSSGKTA